MIFGPICNVLPAIQRNVDILLELFNMLLMSCRLFSEMRTFCRMIFGPICDPAAWSAKFGCFVTGFFYMFVMFSWLFS
jgi:hypothetical protein